jgi:hypothetical protein
MVEKGGSRGWITTQVVEWHLGRKGSGYVVSIPPGREFESSVPWWATWIIHPDDPRFLLAALIHDHLLEDGFRPYTAAGEWYDAALKGGAPRWLALTAALFVTLHTVFKIHSEETLA